MSLAESRPEGTIFPSRVLHSVAQPGLHYFQGRYFEIVHFRPDRGKRAGTDMEGFGCIVVVVGLGAVVLVPGHGFVQRASPLATWPRVQPLAAYRSP